MKKKETFLLKKILIPHDFNFHISLFTYISYIKDCLKLKKYDKIKIINKNPFLSICISAYNIGNLIEFSIVSVLNQSFQDFEIIIINDFLKDNTFKIIEKLQMEDRRIKIINNKNNKGIYFSKAKPVLNSKGKYILYLDSDDIKSIFICYTFLL